MVVLDVEAPVTRDLGQAPRRWLRRSLVVLTVVGFEQTHYLVPPQGSRFAFSVRNEGCLGVEVSDPVPDDANVLYDVVGFQPPAEPSQGFQTGGPLTDAVTIGPGEEATVVLAFAVPRCISIVTGGGVGAESLPLQVRSLGLTTDQDAAAAACLGEGSRRAGTRLLSRRRGRARRRQTVPVRQAQASASLARTSSRAR